MRWQPTSEWIEGGAGAPEALVDPLTLAAVAARFGSVPQRTRARRDAKHTYLLRGLLHCGICGRKLQASARPSRASDGRVRILYRCEFGPSRSIPDSLAHPPTVYVREDAIVSRLDKWLANIVTPEALAAAQTPPAHAAARDSATRAAIADCDLRIDRLLASVEHGMPPEWIATRVVNLRAERDRIQATLPDKRTSRPLSLGEIRAMADALGGLVRILKEASPQDRAAVYHELGIRLDYHPDTNCVHAKADFARVARGVGGGT